MSGEPTELSFSSVIENADPILFPKAEDKDAYLAPGFVDLQVNGFAGVDYNHPGTTPEEIGRSLDVQFATGVTRVYPTVITGSHERITGSLRALAKARAELPHGAAMEAFHVEGPFISPEDGPRGAHPVAAVRPPDFDEFRQFQDAADGHVRLMTVSPEWPGAPSFIEKAVREGVVISIGHTKANAQQIADAVSAGASMSTHLGNGAHAILARHPNYLWDQLAEDRLTASFIVDGIHLGAAFLKTALRAKGLERAVLITDAVMPAGCQPGPYVLGEVAVELHADGSVRLAGGTRLAGSALRMDHAIGNVVKMTGITLRDAVTLASRNPARAGRINGRQRGLVPGERADIVRFQFRDGAVRILETWCGGRKVYTAAAN